VTEAEDEEEGLLLVGHQSLVLLCHEHPSFVLL
jgi:hypothetical protein